MSDIKKQLLANKDAVIARYQSGEGQTSIGRSFGCTGPYIYQFLKSIGAWERRVSPQVEPNLPAILELHAQGFSANAINKKLGLDNHVAKRALNGAGIDISNRSKLRKRPLALDKEEIAARYLAGEGTGSIARSFGTTESSITILLHRIGVPVRSLRDYAHSVNEAFFDSIDSENKAYVLGFWMADGSNSPQIPSIRLAITDRDILESIAEAIEYHGPLLEVKPRRKNRKTQWAIKIGSRKLSDALAWVGCVRGKTYTAMFPSDGQVPPELHRHLIRGWMDGDGTITSRRQRHSRRCPRVWMMRIVGTEDACRGIQACFTRHLGIKGSVCPVHRGPTHTTWGYTIGSQGELEKALHWLYDDCTIRIERKYLKAQEFFARQTA